MKTSEMIAALEKNPKLIFPNGDFCLFRQGDKILLQGKDGTGVPMILFDMTTDWQPVREPVPVWEAIKAYVEGKNISCAYEEGWEQYPKNKNEVIFTHKEYEGVGFTSHLLLNGIWYIEDNPHG